MSNDASTVKTEEPAPQSEPTGSINLKDAATAKPDKISVTAELAPLTAAGVSLVRLVLGLTAAAIAILILLLAVMEFRNVSKANKVYDNAMATALTAPSSIDQDKMTLLVAELKRAQSDPAWVLSAPDQTEALSIIQKVSDSESVTADQKKTLSVCVPIPTSADRITILGKCIVTLNQIASSQSLISERIKLLTDLQKQSNEERAAFRLFWVQIAQMILMNLFFPLITALLGYIFGTQQSAKST